MCKFMISKSQYMDQWGQIPGSAAMFRIYPVGIRSRSCTIDPVPNFSEKGSKAGCISSLHEV